MLRLQELLQIHRTRAAAGNATERRVALETIRALEELRAYRQKEPPGAHLAR
ncbi:hypothetical protein [Neobittarella massiliensis]|uniref:hypothetical protein n=1 Tax=Neobittarella massiliensis (ex Bilen et al. 2018) TaxID=2041842 RepID=UPI0013EB0112|nr:hypothetical protein [Neobittarella massiliensis]